MIDKAFGMLALAIATTKPREDLVKLGFEIREMPESLARPTEEAVLKGLFKCYVPDPKPIAFIVYRGQRTVWGINVMEQASWCGKFQVLQSAAMTPDEARAKGIPVPDDFPAIPDEEGATA